MNISLIIPQLFYDLIARIVPGLTILATSYFVWKGQDITTQNIYFVLEWFASKGVFSIFVLFSFLIISYTLSLLLNGLGIYLEKLKIFSCIFNRGYDDIIEKVACDFKEMKPPISDCKFPSISIMYDLIRLQEPDMSPIFYTSLNAIFR